MSYHDQLLYQITHRIRQSLDLKDILATTVQEIRAFLSVDRVKIYRFEPDGSGAVIAESVDLQHLPSLLHLHFPVGDIPETSRQRFVALRQRVIVDIQTQHKSVDSAPCPNMRYGTDQRYSPVNTCHAQYLRTMGVVSSLVMPILHQGRLWGLLSIHHSRSRRFSRQELTTLRLLSDQLEIAIAQSRLLSQARFQARQEAVVNRVSQLLHCPLSLEDIRQRVLETTVMALSGSGGQLYLTADPVMQKDALFTIGSQPQSYLPTLPAWQTLMENGSACYPQEEPLPQMSLDTLGTRAHPDGMVHRDEKPLWQQISPPHIHTVQELAQEPSLAAAFSRSQIRTVLATGLRFQGEYLGYLVVFRDGYDEEILWAGHRDLDERNQRPRISFETWRELRKDQTPPWTSEELRLMQAISVHVYMATLQQQLTAKLKYQAYHDSLTKLANRLLFTEQLNLNLVQVHEGSNLMAVGFLDLDRFKAINDTLGHDAGDELLTVVADRLRQCLRPCDTVARWGGDEFTVIFDQLDHVNEVTTLAEGLLASLATPICLGKQELVVTASLGLALFPYDGETAEVLLKHADMALNQAKEEGKNTFHLYRESQHEGTLNTLVLESDLRKALDANELDLWYQPQVRLDTGEVVGVEALARWHHEKLGLIPPDRFIPLAEETGLIRQLGTWALRKACEQHARWRQVGLPPMRIAVNLSALQLRDPELVFTVQQALRRYNVPPECLELEITETAAMQDVDLTLRTLKQLQHWGVQIALDDFGMGYSSLNTIKHLPVQTLKIDKSFVQDAVDNPSDAAIAKTIVALGKGLGLSVLAEGVETSAQLQFLWSIGCDYGQGYLLGKPMVGEEWMAWLAQSTRMVKDHIFLKIRQAA